MFEFVRRGSARHRWSADRYILDFYRRIWYFTDELLMISAIWTSQAGLHLLSTTTLAVSVCILNFTIQRGCIYFILRELCLRLHDFLFVVCHSSGFTYWCLTWIIPNHRFVWWYNLVNSIVFIFENFTKFDFVLASCSELWWLESLQTFLKIKPDFDFNWETLFWK